MFELGRKSEKNEVVSGREGRGHANRWFTALALALVMTAGLLGLYVLTQSQTQVKVSADPSVRPAHADSARGAAVESLAAAAANPAFDAGGGDGDAGSHMQTRTRPVRRPGM